MNKVLIVLVFMSFLGCSERSIYNVVVMNPCGKCYLFVNKDNEASIFKLSNSHICIMPDDSIYFVEKQDSLIFSLYSNNLEYMDICKGINYSLTDTSNICYLKLRFLGYDKDYNPGFVAMDNEIILSFEDKYDTIFFNKNYQTSFLKSQGYNKLYMNDWYPILSGFDCYPLAIKDTVYIDVIHEHFAKTELVKKIVINKDDVFLIEKINGTTWYVLDSLEVERGFVNGYLGLIPK